MKKTAKYFSYLVLILMVLSSCLVFGGIVSVETNKIYMMILTVAWFISAPVWMLSGSQK